MSVQVRDAAKNDMFGCRLCRDAVAQEGRWLSRPCAVPLERYATFWASLREARAPQTVAVDGEAIVGWCDIIPDASPVRSTWEVSALACWPVSRQGARPSPSDTGALSGARSWA